MTSFGHSESNLELAQLFFSATSRFGVGLDCEGDCGWLEHSVMKMSTTCLLTMMCGSWTTSGWKIQESEPAHSSCMVFICKFSQKSLLTSEHFWSKSLMRSDSSTSSTFFPSSPWFCGSSPEAGLTSFKSLTGETSNPEAGKAKFCAELQRLCRSSGHGWSFISELLRAEMGKLLLKLRLLRKTLLMLKNRRWKIIFKNGLFRAIPGGYTA